MIGLVSISFRETNWKDLVDICAEAGIQAIEWGADVHVPPQDLEHVKKVKEYCDSKGISCPTYGSYYRLREQENVTFSALIQAAKVLGAETIRVWPGKVSSADADETYVMESAKELAALGDLAEKDGLKVALEYHWDTLTDTAESTLNLLEKTNKDNVMTYWQINPARNLEEHLQEIKLLSGRIVNVHTYFWEGRTRLPFADGEEDWRKYIHAFKDTNVPFMLEHIKDDSVTQLYEDVKVLKKLVEEAT